MTRRMMLIALLAAALDGCDTTDPRMGLATAHNAVAEQAAAQAPAIPVEGGSAVRGVGAMQRYLTGKVHQPVSSTAEPLTVPGDTGVSPPPR